MTFAFYALLTFFFVLCVLFAGLILVQKGRGGGISSAFGGAGGNTAFGSKTGDVLTWATSIVFGIFLVCCVCLSLLANEVDRQQTGRGLVAPGAPGVGTVPAVAPTTTAPAPAPEQPTTTPIPAQPGAIINPTAPTTAP